MRRLSNPLRLLSLLVLVSLATARTSASPAFQDLSWRLLGPLRAGWSLCVEGLPDQLDTYYFGAADGGVWKTNDSGLTWRPISDQAPFSSVGALALVAGEKPVIYVGSGQVQTRYDVMDGTGVYRSSDDGATWELLGLENTRHIGRIWVDPRDSRVLLVAALGSLFGSSRDRGVYRSENGGKSWTRVAFVDEQTGAVDLAADSATPQVIYAAFWQTRRFAWQGYHVPQVGPGSGIWKSIDGGRTFNPTSRDGLPAGPLGRIGLAVAPGRGGQRVYASVDAQRGAGVYSSDDGGLTWTAQREDRSYVGNYMGRIFADPQEPDVVYGMGQSFRRSMDRGRTFSFLKGSPGGDDYHHLWINPKHPERMALASDQGTTVTVNGGLTWSPWYNQATGQFYRLGIDPRFPYRVLSGQQDNGTVSIASRSNYGQLTFRDWHSVGGDERDGDLPDPTDPNMVYGSGLGGKLSRWDARTGRVANVSPWPISSYGQRPAGLRNRTTWITPIAISPRPPHALFQGTQHLHRSLDKGQSWQTISPDLTGAQDGALGCEGEPPLERASACGFGVIFAISPSALRDGLIWVGTDNGRVQLTQDDGVSWQDVTPPGLADWSQVAAVDASPTDPGTAYVAVDRHRLDDRQPYVYVTHDLGGTWRRADDSLPREATVTVVRQDPVRPSLLYAGTRIGAFVSLDDGARWQPLQLNLPRTQINDLAVVDDDLVAATQGRALWVLDDLTPLRHAEPSVAAGAAAPKLAPPVAALRLSANENKDTPLPPEFPTTPNPPTGAVLDYFLPAVPSAPIELTILDAEGAVVRTFRGDHPPQRPAARQYFHDRWLQPLAVPSAKLGHNRFVWNLRYSQPKATDYEFSIAATPDRDTPTLPQGSLVLPGLYTVRLTVDGMTLEQPLHVEKDPRSPATQADFTAQLALSREVMAALQRVITTLEAAESFATQLQPVAEGTRSKPSKLQLEARALLVRAEALRDGGENGLANLGGVFSGLLADLEGADGPPTAAQREVYRLFEDHLRLGEERWRQLEASPSRQLRRLLAKT